jgi:nucleoside-diphosphate-sugar epimerase
VARALLVGCGCRGRALGTRLLADGWQVRGTARRRDGLAAIEADGIEAVLADPDRVVTVLDNVEGVTAIGWLLGSARGEPAAVAAIHGPRLERLCAELVDTPVRGVVYESSGAVASEVLRGGETVVRTASERWRMPFETVDADPADWRPWVSAAAAAFSRLVAR